MIVKRAVGLLLLVVNQRVGLGWVPGTRLSHLPLSLIGINYLLSTTLYYCSRAASLSGPMPD